MKKILITIFFLLTSIFLYTSFANEIIDETVVEENITDNTIDINAYDIGYKKNLFIDDTLKIDLSEIVKYLKEKYPKQDISFEWNLKGEATKKGEIFKKKFTDYGKKEINLNIYKEENNEKKLINNSKLDLFIYKKSLAFIFNDKIGEEKIEDFINMAMKSGIYIYNIGILKEKDIKNIKLIENIKKYKTNINLNSDYIGIWGEKEFLFSVMSKINKEETKIDNKEKINLVLISPFNTTIIKNYLSNLVSNKSSIKDILFIDESIRFQIINTPLKISKLENSLVKNKYDFLKLNPKNKIEHYFFVSKFINNLSNKGFSTTSIYIIILLPFLFTLVSFFKHFVGLSPLGLIISIFFSILFLKVGILLSTMVMSLLIIINLIISKVINKYTLLYTPKISFIAIINIIIFIIALNLLFEYSMLDINLSDTIYIILFIIISERLITIVISKEFREYKNNLLNTFIISIFAFLIFNLDLVRTFILAYPEIIIFLIPINFIIGRFTGLRITEYFRFREVIKSIEEE